MSVSVASLSMPLWKNVLVQNKTLFGDSQYCDFAIAASGSTSATCIVPNGWCLCGVTAAADGSSWTSAAISFAAAPLDQVTLTFGQFYDLVLGLLATGTLAGGEFYSLPVGALYSARFIQFVSGTLASPTTQSSATSVRAIIKPL